MAIYFGGSRNLQSSSIIPQVVAAVVAQGQVIHVGCQFGADQQVIQSAPLLSLVVFAVLSSSQYPFNHHVPAFYRAGGLVRFCAGGQQAPMQARFLLRSIAAFQGCESAVFFNPGSGSLAVARECVKSGLPVYVMSWQSVPQSIPSCAGYWVASIFAGFPAWRWQPAQLSLI